MKMIPQIPAGKGSEIGDLDLAGSFFRAGEMLYSAAYDGITKNAEGAIGCPTDEVFHGYLLIAFYNFRHAIELKMKELASMLEISGKFLHRLSDLWDEILKHPKISSGETVVTEALLVLAEYNLLQEEELIRYAQRNKSPNQLLKDYPAIPAKSFGLLGEAYQALRQATLELLHESKFGAIADS